MDNTKNSSVPAREIESLARCLLPYIQNFYNSEEGKREFEEWKKSKENQNK